MKKLIVTISFGVYARLIECDQIEIKENKIYLLENKKSKAYYPIDKLYEVFIKTK